MTALRNMSTAASLASTKPPIGASAVPHTASNGGELVVRKMPCRECDGKGEAEYMGLCEDRYHWRRCHKCNGSGQEKPYCDTCGETLKADGFCVSCDDFALVYVERIAPGRVAL